MTRKRNPSRARVLIAETARRLRTRLRGQRIAPLVPPAIAAATLALIGDLTPLVSVIYLVALGVFSARVPDQTRTATERIDAVLGAEAHFLTLATTDPSTDQSR